MPLRLAIPLIRAPAFRNDGTDYVTRINQGIRLLNSQLLQFGTTDGTDADLFHDGSDLYFRLNTGGLTIGLAASAPAPDNNAVHIWKGTAGTIAANAGALLTLETNTDSLILQFLTPNTATDVGLIAGDPQNANVARFTYHHVSNYWSTWANGAEQLRHSAGLMGFQVATNIVMGAGYLQVTEMAAPGAASADQVRVYAVVGGDTFSDLAAVFQDGTVDIFAQEVTPLDSPIFRYPSQTEGSLRLRKPHPGLQIFEMVFPDGSSFVLREIRHHDAKKIAASQGAEGPLPAGWLVETAAERAKRAALIEAK